MCPPTYGEQTRGLQAQEQARLLELATEVAGVGYWRVDLGTNALTWSDEVYRIHGLDPETHTPTVEHAIGSYHPQDRERVARHVAEAIEERRPFDFELRLIRSDGAVREVTSKGRVQLDDAGSPVAVFGIFQDVTERRELERRLRQTERLASLGTLAAGLAHELNNPLTYVMGNLDLLREGLGGWPKLIERVDVALQGAEHMQRIVAGLRAFSRAQEQEGQALYPLEEVIDDALTLCENHLRHRCCALVQERAAPLPWVRGDRSRLVQVLVNLLLNACQALPDGAATNRIVLRAFVEDGRAVVEIEDNGRGIPPELQQRVFDPFFTTRDVGEGTGLGLSVCHGTIQQHGGTLALESRPGRTCFRVSLPAAEAAAAVPPPDGATQGRVLIVEDDPQVGELMKLGLEANGLEAELVGGGAAALALIDAGEAFDVVVSDLMMPGLSGEALHGALTCRRPALAESMLFVTGGVFTPNADAFLRRLPEGRLLLKPFPGRVLAEQVRALLSERVAGR